MGAGWSKRTDRADATTPSARQQGFCLNEFCEVSEQAARLLACAKEPARSSVFVVVGGWRGESNRPRQRNRAAVLSVRCLDRVVCTHATRFHGVMDHRRQPDPTKLGFSAVYGNILHLQHARETDTSSSRTCHELASSPHRHTHGALCPRKQPNRNIT
ncbi:uncharacterized protein BKA78DRAFT_110817 [Phyllosticta capitalensis]|uniref:uncharacterized protein n=1 Tax=Phyllosticta capitalensis TaxID=121624 RepID=UPI0031312DDD